MSFFSGSPTQLRPARRAAATVTAAAAIGLSLLALAPAAQADNANAVTYTRTGGASATPSKGLPAATSGYDTGLWGNASTVSRTVNATAAGGSHIRVVGRGGFCQGWPIVSVAVDGTTVGTVTLDNSTMNLSHDVGSKIPAGQHTVTVQLTNDKYLPGDCDRNAFITSVDVASDVADATSAGVPSGVKLTEYDGTLVVKQDGTVINGLDIHGELAIKANNVTVVNTRVRGGNINSYNQKMSRYSLLSSTGSNNLIEDTTLHADTPNPNWNGLTGYGFTAKRVDISGTVDTIVTSGDNVTVDGSFMHDNLQYEHDYSWSLTGGPSHSDGWQVEGGSNLTLVNSTILNPQMTAIIMTQNAGKTNNFDIEHNYLAGGACQINFADNAKRGAETGVTIANNTFGPVSSTTFFNPIAGCHIMSQFQTGHSSTVNVPSSIVHPGLTVTNNTSTDGYPVIVKRGA